MKSIKFHFQHTKFEILFLPQKLSMDTPESPLSKIQLVLFPSLNLTVGCYTSMRKIREIKA
jgi:hypothetical protein